MNVLSLFTTAVLAAESLFFPSGDTTSRPVVSFADLLETVRPMESKGAVLGTGTFSATIVAGEASPPQLRTTKKPFYTVAFLGDSMTDTLGADLGLVRDELSRVYPFTSFRLLNYGVGGENIVSGLERVIADTVYLGVLRPSLVSQNPDVIVIESFAYNPFPFEIGALEHHWLSLAYLVDAIRANIPDSRIVIAATIAPNSKIFGDGAPGVAFLPEDKWQRTQTIKRYLENATRFAQSENIALADAYHPSLDTTGEGRLIYINPGDHIHYSDAGRQMFARTVVDTIVSRKLLEE
ncbi:SGNH/GDSL hydrolase family protein [Candidatus Gottesmanbacteria bacterium]|nr:SGNH/GDSL hydrolase family protein [Candidatus Gottesmanbacteria bacterium]